MPRPDFLDTNLATKGHCVAVEMTMYLKRWPTNSSIVTMYGLTSSHIAQFYNKIAVFCDL